MGHVYESDKCVVCLEAKPQIILKPCMHKCLCNSCKRYYMKLTCPVCREEISPEQPDMRGVVILIIFLIFILSLGFFQIVRIGIEVENLKRAYDIRFQTDQYYHLMGPSGPRGPPGYCDSKQVQEAVFKYFETHHKKLEKTE